MSLQKKVTGVFLFLLAAWGIWYVTSLSITPEDNGAYLQTGTQNQEKSDVFFELSEYTVTYPAGHSQVYDVSLPYIIVGGEKVFPFGEDKNIWVRGHVMSYNKSFLYIGKGAGPSDAGVQAYVYDVADRELHMVEVLGQTTLGFAREDLALVWWETDGLMYVEYENPVANPSTQRYVSVSPETPWIMEVWN